MTRRGMHKGEEAVGMGAYPGLGSALCPTGKR